MVGFYLSAQFLSHYLNISAELPVSNVFFAFLLGAMMAPIGQLGDLLVSMAKRRTGDKDTGVVIPGHGGLLDRIDSLLLASMFFFIVLKSVG